MKRIAALLPLLILLLTGCIQATGLNELTVVQSLSLDYADGNYTMTLQFYSPEEPKKTESSKTENSEPQTISSTGKSLGEILSDCEQQYGGYLYLGRCELLILGENIARNMLESVVDYFFDSSTFNIHALVVVASGDPAELLSLKRPNTPASSNPIAQKLHTASELGQTVISTLIDTAVSLRDGQGSFVLPLIAKGDSDTDVTADTVAVIREGGYFSTLTPDETTALCWLIGDARHAVVSTNDGKGGVCTAELQRAGLSIEPMLYRDTFYLQLDLQLRGSLGEDAGDMDLSEAGQLFEEKINTDIEYLLHKILLRDGVDLLLLEQRLRQQFPEFYEKNAQDFTPVFTNCQLKLSVGVSLEGTAGTGRGLLRQEGAA